MDNRGGGGVEIGFVMTVADSISLRYKCISCGFPSALHQSRYQVGPVAQTPNTLTAVASSSFPVVLARASRNA